MKRAVWTPEFQDSVRHIPGVAVFVVEIGQRELNSFTHQRVQGIHHLTISPVAWWSLFAAGVGLWWSTVISHLRSLRLKCCAATLSLSAISASPPIMILQVIAIWSPQLTDMIMPGRSVWDCSGLSETPVSCEPKTELNVTSLSSMI